MKYKIGDKVKVKSLNWYNANKDEFGRIYCGDTVFIEDMVDFLGGTFTIKRVYNDNYYEFEEDNQYGECSFTDEMLEDEVVSDISFTKKTMKLIPEVKDKIEDMVNHPSHYCNSKVECIDAMIAAFGEEEVAIFCKINAFKYLWRCNNKNRKEDIRKGGWYINKNLELT